MTRFIRHMIWLIPALSLFSGNSVYSQTVEGTSIPRLIEKLKLAKTDSERVLLLLAEGELYRLRVGTLKTDMDSAMLYARQAQTLSSSIGYRDGYKRGVMLEINTLLEQNDIVRIKDRMAGMKKDDVLTHVLIALAKYYLEQAGALKNDMDSAFYYADEAMKLSRSIRCNLCENGSLRVLGRYYFDKNDIPAGRKYFLLAIASLHQNGKLEDEANYWIDYGYRLPDRDSLFDEKAACVTRCIEIFHQLGETDKEIWALKARAEIYRRQGKLETAEAESAKILQMQKRTGAQNIHETYNILSEIAMFRGDYSKALEYGLSSLEAITLSHDTIYAGVIYEKLANIYSEMNDHAKSLEWYDRALRFYTLGNDEEEKTRLAALMALQLIADRSPEEALETLKKRQREFKSKDPVIREMFANAMGATYSALNDFENAKKHYDEMIDVERQTRIGNQNSANAYYAIGKFYLESKNYAVARLYLDTALIAASGRVPMSRVRDIYLMLFKADSSLGKYNLAIENLQAYHILNDSIYNDKKIRQIAKIQTQYEINKREKDITILQGQALFQQQQIRQSVIIRRYTYAVITMLLLLLGLGYNRYRLKQKAQKQLMIKQTEISAKNLSLQQLVKEKEWLVREVHHRVKNNLQIVMSLLSAQTNYLNNELALEAVNESRNRMQAISLIHQKLYLPESPQTIEVNTYIREFVSFLKESFSGTQKIFFDLQIADVKLNISQAVPIGLIINEAVTNSIKHAFPGGRNGRITISLQASGMPDQLVLLIADNGTGLSSSIVDFEKCDTLGIKLIKTFCEQLEGQLRIYSQPGLRLEITFLQYNEPLVNA